MLISEFTPMGAVELRRMDGEAYMTRRAEVLELSANLPEDVTIEQMESVDSELNLYSAEDEHRASVAALNAEKRQLIINGGGKTIESVATAAVNTPTEEAPTMPNQVRTLGDHFAGFAKREGHGKSFHLVAPAYSRAYNDVQMTPDKTSVPEATQAITTYDKNVVEAVRESMGVLNLLGREVIEGNTLVYFVEGAMEGTIATSINEGAEKSRVHFADPTPVTVSLEKIAAYIKESDEFIDDYGFLASAINGRLVYELNLVRQAKVIANLLATSGIQTISGVTRTAVDIADEIANAIADTMTYSGRPANAIVMTPELWKLLRIGKNEQKDYYGGGYFAALHGENIWNLPIVLSNQLTANHIVVGAFDTCASLVTKAEGVTVEATNTDQDDFIKNLMTIRAEVREKLAVRRPAGFVDITVAAGESGQTGDTN